MKGVRDCIKVYYFNVFPKILMYTNLHKENQFFEIKDEVEKFNASMYYTRSVNILEAAIKFFPDHAGLYYLLSLTYFKMKEFSFGIKYLKKGEEYDSKKNTYLGLISRILYEMNDLQSAYDYAAKAYEINVMDLDALLCLGNIELLKYNYEESLSYGISAVSINKDNYEAVRLLSRIYIAMGVETEDTLKILLRAEELGKDNDLTTDIIKILYVTEKYMSCIKACQTALSVPCSGYNYGKINKYVNALADYCESILKIKLNTRSTLSRDAADIIDKFSENHVEDKKTEEKENSIENILNHNKKAGILANKVIKNKFADFKKKKADFEETGDLGIKLTSREITAEELKEEELKSSKITRIKKQLFVNKDSKEDKDKILENRIFTNKEKSENKYVNNHEALNKNSEINRAAEINRVSLVNKSSETENTSKINKECVTDKNSLINKSAETDKNSEINKTADKEEKNPENFLNEALDKLNSLTGLHNVKKEVNKIIKLVKYEKKRNEILNINETGQKHAYNFAFLGNPGTGKSTVARLLGDIFYSLGILEKGHLVEADRSSLVGRYVGETAKLTKKIIDKAIGGILFIDEAYSLAKDENSSDYGKEAVETLLKEMEDRRGEFIVILAGYTKEMKKLLKLNPGLEGRINMQIMFDDYTDEELCDIGNFIAEKEHYILSDEGRKAFKHKINELRVDENFANGRCARNLIEEAIREKAYRLSEDEIVNNEFAEAELTTLTDKDFCIDLGFTARKDIEECEKELNSLIGLKNVKKIVKEILNTLEFMHKREETGVKNSNIVLHMEFTGNPGTGKTTVARIIAKMFKAMGILKKGHLVEVTRTDLVGEYVGQTGPKTIKKIKEAYGGVLFIDEAYSLCGQGADDFGKEALAALIKEMEDSRDKLVVIMAGYTKEMHNLMNLNPGLESRIKFKIEFPDYNEEELFSIFKNLCLKENYILTDEAAERVKENFKRKCIAKSRNFGNGRYVRKMFEDIKMKQATRIIENGNVKESEFSDILPEDIEYFSEEIEVQKYSS